MNVKSILLIEDNSSDIELTRRAFKKNNITNPLIVANTGQEALDLLFSRASGALPTLTLLDLKLPGMDGLEVLRRIRAHERTRLMPVVILTSSKQDEDLLESYRRGANSFIRKPVDFVQFTEAIRQLGLYWLLLNESPPET